MALNAVFVSACLFDAIVLLPFLKPKGMTLSSGDEGPRECIGGSHHLIDEIRFFAFESIGDVLSPRHAVERWTTCYSSTK